MRRSTVDEEGQVLRRYQQPRQKRLFLSIVTAPRLPQRKPQPVVSSRKIKSVGLSHAALSAPRGGTAGEEAERGGDALLEVLRGLLQQLVHVCVFFVFVHQIAPVPSGVGSRVERRVVLCQMKTIKKKCALE